MKKTLKKIENNDFIINVTNIRGDATNIRGDVTGVYGDATDICGNFNECEITNKERKLGISISDLIL